MQNSAPTPSKLTKDQREEEVKKAIEKAKEYRKGERFQEGIDLLVNVLKYRVKEDQVYYRLGNIYYDAGDLDRAEYAYRRAIEKNKMHVNAHHNLSVVYKKQGKIAEFVKMKKKTTRLTAKNPAQTSLSPEKVKWLKSLGYKLMMGIGGLLVLIAGVIFLVKWI